MARLSALVAQGSAATLDEWVWVHTAPDAIALLEAGGVTELSLDHDLGNERQVGSGYRLGGRRRNHG